MVCAGKGSVYAFVIGIVICAQGFAIEGRAKDANGDSLVTDNSSVSAVSSMPVTGFQWKEHQKLSWEDFRGPVNATSDESAAATHCGMGFKVNTNSGKPQISVYNTFYINKSWVRPDAKIASILVHEQGHFDLCEIYTRKLQSMMDRFDFSVADMKGALMAIFNKVNNEYEQRQQAYETETAHGTNIEAQQKWLSIIYHELN